MANKRAVKKLMAMGIQRNDAVGFLKASRILVSRGMADLVPGMIRPIPHIAVEQQEILKLRSTFAMSIQTLQSGAIDFETYAKNRLGDELLRGVLRSGAITYTKRKDSFGGIVFDAELNVVISQKER